MTLSLSSKIYGLILKTLQFDMLKLFSINYCIIRLCNFASLHLKHLL